MKTIALLDHKKILQITLFIECVILCLYAYKQYHSDQYSDFSVYYRAALRAHLHEWSEIYTLTDGASPFRYIPALILFFRPFALLTLNHAKLLWYFIQHILFCSSFYWIYRSLCLPGFLAGRTLTKITAANIACLTFLYLLRFHLDSYTIGQVSSVIVFCFSYGLYAWNTERPFHTALALMGPAALKIGPTFLFGVFLTDWTRSYKKIFLAIIMMTVALLISTLALTHSFDLTLQLYQHWIQIVLLDSTYYDASHYGSQSIKSFLLRCSNQGWISPLQADYLWVSAIVLLCISVVLFWWSRRPTSLYGRSLFFSLGIYIYLLLMPETFKYSLTALAIPISLLLICPTKTRFTWFALISGLFTLTIAGKDVIGHVLFFANQLQSYPLFSTLFLGIATFQQAKKHSRFFKNLATQPPQIWIQPTHITADDWGMSPGINQGILELAQKGMIRRVSLMANTPFLEEGLSELKAIPGIHFGLHFNLTHGKQRPTPLQLLIRWLHPLSDRNLLRQEIRDELKKQLSILEKNGIVVRSLEAHHHIHLIPGLIAATSDLLHEAGIQHIRLPLDYSLFTTRQAPLIFLSLLARPQIQKFGFQTLPCRYPPQSCYQSLDELKRYLSADPHAEIITHPARVDDLKDYDCNDSYTVGRVLEYQTLRALALSLLK